MDTQRERALVIEDDFDLSNIFVTALEQAGYEAEAIRDGKEAQERLKTERPDLVILDMHLPHVSGAELLIQMRSDERLKGVIVVIATADARLGETYTDVADFVLIKPITFIQMRDLTVRLHKKPPKTK
jgi:DNA-binding response OmpR family regulator